MQFCDKLIILLNSEYAIHILHLHTANIIIPIRDVGVAMTGRMNVNVQLSDSLLIVKLIFKTIQTCNTNSNFED